MVEVNSIKIRGEKEQGIEIGERGEIFDDKYMITILWLLITFLSPSQSIGGEGEPQKVFI